MDNRNPDNIKMFCWIDLYRSIDKTMLMEGHERIFQILYKEDEVTWQSLLHELIKKEQMNPWDVNVSLLTKNTLKQ